jgi:preprotein translocase subunit SecG
MTTVILVVHLMLALALVAVVLLQRSEGGALGIGGGGGGGFLTGRGTANLLTRTTAILAACFFATSIALTLLANHASNTGSVFDRAPAKAAPTSGETYQPKAAEPGRGGILDKLGPAAPAPGPTVPQSK